MKESQISNMKYQKISKSDERYNSKNILQFKLIIRVVFDLFFSLKVNFSREGETELLPFANVELFLLYILLIERASYSFFYSFAKVSRVAPKKETENIN